MKLTNNDSTMRGGFADVFRINSHVIKIYKNINHPDVNDDLNRGENENNFRRHHFQSEFEAFQTASQNADLKIHIPKFYGSVNIENVTDEDGANLSNNYMLDCNIKLDFLTGEEIDFPKIQNDYSEVVQLFQSNDINHLIDSAAFIKNNSIKLIDIAMEDAYANAEEEWIINN